MIPQLQHISANFMQFSFCWLPKGENHTQQKTSLFLFELADYKKKYISSPIARSGRTLLFYQNKIFFSK